MSRKRSGLRKSWVVVGVLALVVPLLFAFAAPVSAATRCVNTGGTGGCYGSIQAAVNAAGGGDVINVYPGTYNESVDLGGHSGALTLRTVNAAGNPTPGTATVNGGTTGPAFYTSSTHSGDITIDGFIGRTDGASGDDGIRLGVNSSVVIRNVTASNTGEDGIEISEAGANVTIANCTANSNDSDGILVQSVGGDVSVSDCTANNNHDENFDIGPVTGNLEIKRCTANGSEDDEGIEVDEVGGSVTITDSTANNNEDEGIEIDYVGMVAPQESGLGADDLDGPEPDDDDDHSATLGHSVKPSANGGDVTIKNCTTNGNGEPTEDDDGIEISWVEGKVTISSCIARDNLDDGIDLSDLKEADSILVNANIICGNVSDGLELAIDVEPEEAAVAATSADATGNWWGCAGGPGAAGCDTVNEIDGSVDYTPWIDTITVSAPGSAMAGEPAPVTFQFSDSGRTVFLGQGPGDLHGDPTFIVSTDNGTVVDPGFINEPHGVLAATLIPASGGTATVTLDGPCGLDAAVALGTWEFVPELGSVLLLGSGLMGLAGYAGLRLRKR